MMLSRHLYCACFALATMALALSGCDDGGGGSNDATMTAGDTSTGEPLAQNCNSRCETKATSCQAPASTAGELCNGLCGQSVTESQAQCLENSSCNELTALFIGGGTICDIGTSSGPTCGDGSCDSGEDSSSCPQDCSSTTPSCGDGVCDTSAGETLSNCFSDCDTETGGEVGDRCECDGPTFECSGTENGCRFSLSGSDSLRCFVNSADTNVGFCSDSCEGADDTSCPDGGTCNLFRDYIQDMEVWRCE